jgi:tRNA G18 (ribose-2'-O)-methylase SpoU
MPPLVLVLDNIRSLYNVGSMFRTADGFGVGKIFLCGITGTPEQNGLKKVALGAELVIPWEHRPRTWSVVEQLKREGYYVVGLEKCRGAVSLRDFRPPPGRPLALVVGNEVRGLTPALRRRLDATVFIPMRGMKESFNVSVAAGVALYGLLK